MLSELSSNSADYQISVFGSPVPRKFPGNVASPIPPPPVRTYQPNQQCQYEIEFPAGSMGLELEPVITSSERTLGCRVKDFYFGVSYDGLDRDYLQEHVVIGDIIIKVNDTSVVSLPFNTILDLLRSLTGKTRTIMFKNITASWEAAYKKEHSLKSPVGFAKSPGGAKGSLPVQALGKEQVRRKDTENVTNGAVAVDVSETAALQQLKAQKAASKKSGSDGTARKALALSPKRSSDSSHSTNSSAASSRASSSTAPGGVARSNSSSSTSNGRTSADSSLNVSTLTAPRAKSPPHNRSLQKLLGYPVAPVAERDSSRLASASSAKSPLSLRHPSLDLTSQAGPLSAGTATTHSSVSPARTRARDANDPPSPRSKLLRSQSFTTNTAVLMLNRTSSKGPRADREQGCRSPLTPSSLMRLKQQQRASGTSSPLSKAPPRSPSEFSFRTEVSSAADAPDYLRAVRVRLEEESIAPEDDTATESEPLEQGPLITSAPSSRVLVDIFEKVKGSIGSGLVQVGNVLGARAERALAETSHMLPLYSTVEMNEVMSKKYDLLNELSQSCMLLGQAEAKEKEFSAMRVYVQQLEANVRDLNDALESAAHTRDSLQFKCKAAETEASVLKAEQAQDREVLHAAKNEAADCQQKVTELVCELAHKDKCVTEGASLVNQLTAELQRFESSLAEQVQRAKEEGATEVARLQSEQADRERAAAARLLASAQENAQLEARVQSLSEKLAAAERDRDQCVAELEVLQEMAAADKQSATSEFARLREGMASQQYLYKEQLIKQDAQFHALKRELSEAQAGLATITDLHHAAEHEKAQLKSRLSAANAEIHQLTTRHAVCQGDLRSAEEAVEQQKALAEEARTKLNEQQVQLVVSASEHGMLSDQAKMAELTVSALHSEIAMLRREIDEQRDLTKLKSIEVMTAISKYNMLAETQLVLKAESEEAQKRLAQNLLDNQEEVALLEGAIAALREDGVAQQALLHAERSAHAAELQSLQAECAVARQCVQCTEAEKLSLVAANESALLQKQGEIDVLRSQHDDLLQALSDLRSAQEALKDEHAALQLNASTSQGSLAQEVVALKRALVEAENAFAASLQLRDSEITSVRSKSDCVESTLALVRAEMSRVVAEYKAEIQRKDAELVALVEGRNLVAEQLEAQGASFEEALQAAKQRYDHREKDFICALRLAEDTQDSLRSDLHQQLADSKEQCTAQAALAAELQQKLSSAEQTISSSTEEVDRLSSTVGVLAEELTAAKAEIAELEAKETAAADGAMLSAAAMSQLCEELAVLRETHAATVTELERAKAQLRNSGCDHAARAVAHEAELAMMQTQVNKTAAALTAAKSARKADQGRVNAALQDMLMELAAVKSNLKETTIELNGLRGVHGSIVKCLTTQNEELKAEMSALVSRQPGALKLEGRLAQLLQEKEAASRRAAVAEQNTIDSEARCVNALTKALAAEKAALESRAQAQQLREAVADLQAANSRAQNEATVLQDLAVMLKNKLNTATDAQSDLQVKLAESSRGVEHVKALLQEARAREKGIEERAHAEHQDAQERLERLLQEKNALERTAKLSQGDLQATVARLTSQCIDLQAQLDAALQKFATEQARWIGEHHALLAQTESQLAADRALREALDAQCTDLRDQVARLGLSATTCRESLESQLLAVHVRSEGTVLEVRAEQERQVATLRNKLLQQEHSFAGQLEAKVAEFADASAKQVAMHQAVVAKLESSHADAMSSMQQHYKLLVDELASERERAEEQLEGAQAECHGLREALSKLKLELHSSTTHAASLASAMEESKSKITALQGELKDVRNEMGTKLADLTVQLTGESTQISALQESVRDKEAQLVRAQVALQTQEVAIREEASLGQLLEAKVKQIRIEADEKSTMLAAAESQLTLLRGRLSGLESEHALMVTAFDSCKSQLSTSALDLQAKMEEIAALRSQVAERESSAQGFKGDVAAVMRDLEVSLERKKELKNLLDHAQLAQRAAEKQASTFKAQVQELRETLITQQNVIADAESREAEHLRSVRKFEQLLADGEARFRTLQLEHAALLERSQKLQSAEQDALHQRLQAELKKVSAIAARTQRALEVKCEELQSLHMHVTELLQSTFSPQKIPRSAKKAVVKHDGADQENVLTEASVAGLSTSTNAVGDFEFTEQAHLFAQWNCRLVECSLQMYEVLVEAFQHLRALQSLVSETSALTDSATFGSLEQTCVKLSLFQHQLHGLLAHSPWIAGDEKAAELDAPHQIARMDIAPSATAVHAQAPTFVVNHRSIAEKAMSPTQVKMNGLIGGFSALNDSSVHASNDSDTLEELLASLAYHNGGQSSNSSMCSVPDRVARSNGRGSESNSLRNSTEEALSQASMVSAEIGDVSFDAFADAFLGGTPPNIKRVLRTVDEARSTGSASGRKIAHREADQSFDSVASDLFNISADTGADSDEDSAVFYHYREN